MIDECRLAFEEWMVATEYGSFSPAKRDDGKYVSSHTHLLWLAFQAAWQHRPQPQSIMSDGVHEIDRISRLLAQAAWHIQALHGGMILIDSGELPDKIPGYVSEGTEGLELLRQAHFALDKLTLNPPAQVSGNALLEAAAEVMALLEEHGPSIVPHLLDSDQNPGRRLRNAIAEARGEKREMAA